MYLIKLISRKYPSLHLHRAERKRSKLGLVRGGKLPMRLQ